MAVEDLFERREGSADMVRFDEVEEGGGGGLFGVYSALSSVWYLEGLIPFR